MALQDESLLHTFQKHIEDMRNLTICKICIKPFYEPYVLRCGHTYCYSCLASWFSGPHNKDRIANCPDCRAEVTSQPAPNYLLRDLVHMFINRAELLPEDETIEEHQKGREEEANTLAVDKAGPGLFKGRFRRRRISTLAHILRGQRGIHDDEDNVTRCPRCTWELEDGVCNQCGWGEDSSSSGDTYESRSNVMSPRSPNGWAESPNERSVDDNLNADIDVLLRELPDDHEGFSDRDDDSMHNLSSTTYDDPDIDDEMDSFIDDEDDEDHPNEIDEVDSEEGEHSHPVANQGFRFYGVTNDNVSNSSGSDSDGDETSTQTTTFDDDTNDETSEQGTNYDESDSDSVQEVPTPAIFRTARRRRVVESEDDDDESSEDDEESDDTAIRPPQSTTNRRNRLNAVRARRSNNHSHPYRRPSPSEPLISRNREGGFNGGQTRSNHYQPVRRGRSYTARVY